jgi:hypothetical protein
MPKKNNIVDLAARREAKKNSARIRCLTMYLPDGPRSVPSSKPAAPEVPEQGRKRGSPAATLDWGGFTFAANNRRRGPFLRYTIEPGRLMDSTPCFFVYGWDLHPKGSKLAGQPRRQRIDCHPTLDSARRNYPNAVVLRIPSDDRHAK